MRNFPSSLRKAMLSANRFKSLSSKIGGVIFFISFIQLITLSICPIWLACEKEQRLFVAWHLQFQYHIHASSYHDCDCPGFILSSKRVNQLFSSTIFFQNLVEHSYIIEWEIDEAEMMSSSGGYLVYAKFPRPNPDGHIWCVWL